MMGTDWICVDMEHGHLDLKEVMEHVRTVRGSDTAVLVRVPSIEQGIVKRVLDLGAHGVVLPLVRSREDLEAGMSYGRYPTEGVRGIGGERSVKWGMGMQDYLKDANEETLIIPLIETKDAVDDIEQILQVPGLEAIFFGPADLSASYGYLGDWEGPGIAEIILNVRAAAAKLGIASGLMSMNAEDAKLRQEQGFNMVGLGSDIGLMIRSMESAMRAVGREPKPHLWF
ncbi:2-dehydro-3-deoxyglucarate aldolase/4-hydroxy-2-oxoheptanedioate aldolase [Paenibacillus sp. CF384]|nr:2-dehydro-3-deoxyglucarate aldolase/4-hydroxy-2-oxoheptanedioate aldolase [Paenibacillus sp. CF384]